MDIKYLATKYKTPLYVYDFDHFTNQYEKLKTAFRGKKSLIAYAVKANSNLSVIKHFATLGAGADCVSIGEVKRALRAGVNPYKIIFSGVGKTQDELKEALQAGLLFINVESEGEMLLLESVAAGLNKQARISLRVNPGVDAKTHPYISTGLSENKFGVDFDTAKRLYLRAKASEHLDPVGIHFHIGSQLLDLAPLKEAALKAAELAKALKAAEIDIKFFDVGGGLGVAYDGESTIDADLYAKAMLAAVKDLDATVICEPGRYLTANGGEFITSVLYEKTTRTKRFVIVDGAMNDLIRPSLYGAFHGIRFLPRGGAGATKADVVGPVCESGDFLAKDVLLPPLKGGDLLAIRSAGAYGFSMSSNYNTRARPAEVALQGGADRLIRARESVEDLYKNEEGLLANG